MPGATAPLYKKTHNSFIEPATSFMSKWVWSKEPGSHCFDSWTMLKMHVKDDF